MSIGNDTPIDTVYGHTNTTGIITINSDLDPLDNKPVDIKMTWRLFGIFLEAKLLQMYFTKYAATKLDTIYTIDGEFEAMKFEHWKVVGPPG